MAYNPFDFFRRNQKLFFAGLTIMVMFMFVLSFGRGDFFSWFPQQLAKWQTYGEVMAVIDGSKVKESQLQDASKQRQLANGYMVQVAEKALATTAVAADSAAKAAGPDFRDDLTRVVTLVSSLRQVPVQTPEEAEFLSEFYSTQVFPLLDSMQNVPTLRTEDKDAVREVRLFAEAARADFFRRSAGGRGEGGMYFTNQPNASARDQLNFLLWRKKADNLGIRYTDADVMELVANEFRGSGLTKEQLQLLAIQVANSQGKKSGELLEALADEFRVRAAQTAVMGIGPARDVVPDPAGTPEERYEHFRDETTATRYSFVTIPVEAYLPLVKGEPTDAELKKIFDEASGSDPDPGSPRPGIREPRKVGVQWVEVTGKEPYYAKLAAQRLTMISPARAVFGTAAVSAGDAFKVVGYDEYLAQRAKVIGYRQSATANPGRPKLNQNLVGAVGSGLAVDPDAPQFFSQSPASDPNDKLLTSEIAKPELAVELTGLTAGAFATAGFPFAPVVAVTETAYRQSRAERVLAGVQEVYIPLLPGLSELVGRVGAEAAAVVGQPGPLPPPAVQSMLDRMTVDALRTVVATEDVRAFVKEMTRITEQTPDKSKGEKAEKERIRKEAADYAANWIANRELSTGSTTQPRDVHSLADDPGLARLLQKDVGVTTFGMPKNPLARTAFGQTFVTEDEFGRAKPSAGVYRVMEYDPTLRRDERQEYAPTPTPTPTVTDSSPLTLVWRTTEIDAVRPLSLASDPTARQKCVTIWKWKKARELARQAAADAAQTIEKAKGNEVQLGFQLREAVEQLKKPLPAGPATDKITENQLTAEAADLPLQESLGAFFPPLVTQFNPQHEKIVYETEKMREELMANKDKPVGTTFVLPDRPDTTLYLYVLTERREKSPAAFRDFVLYPDPTRAFPPNAQFRPLSPGVLNPRFALAERKDEREQAVALLKAEFGYKDENPKLDEVKE